MFVKQKLMLNDKILSLLDEDIKGEIFTPASEKENLEEEREFFAGLELPDCYFWALPIAPDTGSEG